MAERTIRRVAKDGVIRHPLTGEIELTTTDPNLAASVRDWLDQHQPVGVDAVYRMLRDVPPLDRNSVEWVMPSSVYLALWAVAMERGWFPNPTAEDLEQWPEDYLLGKPVVIDDGVQGLSLRQRGRRG